MTTAATTNLLGIGEMAERTGASERGLRYYEEIGLLRPAAHSAGGFRRYDEAGVARVRRIRELQELMGFNLDEIRVVLAAEDRLEELREAWRGHTEPDTRRQILLECLQILDDLRAKVSQKRLRLDEFQAQLEAKVARSRQLLEDVEAQPGVAGREAGRRGAAAPSRRVKGR